MVMFFGKEFINKGKSEGQLGIDSANAAYAQLQKIDPAIQVGLCPCLGKNGSKDEVFTLDDAKILKAFADKTRGSARCTTGPSMTTLPGPAKKALSRSTNSVSVSNSPQPWAFAKIFQTFTTH